jgi:hypothetical protein
MLMMLSRDTAVFCDCTLSLVAVRSSRNVPPRLSSMVGATDTNAFLDEVFFFLSSCPPKIL